MMVNISEVELHHTPTTLHFMHSPTTLVKNVRPFEGRYSAKTGPILMIDTSKHIYSSRRKRLAWSLCVILMRLGLVFNQRFGIEIVVKVEKQPMENSDMTIVGCMMLWSCMSKNMIVFQGTRAIKYFKMIIEVFYGGRFKFVFVLT